MVASIKDWWKKQDTEVSTDPSKPRSTEEFQVNAEGDDLVDRTQNIQGTPGTLPTHDEIEARAFQIYERNGRQEGQAESNWLQAEHELLQEKRNGYNVDGAAMENQNVAESEF
jgi:hypothetical protein